LLKLEIHWVDVTGVTSTTRGAAAPEPRFLAGLIAACAVAVTLACAALACSVVVLRFEVRPVLTGSMAPAFGPGALLVTRPVPVADLRKGMIVLFVPPGEHAEFAHRITSLTGSRTDPVLTTKGDANQAPDPWHARLTSTSVPEVVATVPWAGRLLVGLRGPIQLALIVLGGLIVAIFGSARILHPQPVRGVPA
jgi:signal peptidase I